MPQQKTKINLKETVSLQGVTTKMPFLEQEKKNGDNTQMLDCHGKC